MRLIDADALIAYCDEEWIPMNVDAVNEQPTIEAVPVRKGKWMEKHHAYSDEESGIEEWQSCSCSECGRYDTRPYMYYFSEPNYCSYCGADMRNNKDQHVQRVESGFNALDVLEDLIQRVNTVEIADHLLFESLTKWTEDWRAEAQSCLEEILNGSEG